MIPPSPQGSPVEVRHAFCQQVSAAEYQDQSNTHLQQHMGKLLEDIIADHSMSDKEKKSKLKMVQLFYCILGRWSNFVYTYIVMIMISDHCE